MNIHDFLTFLYTIFCGTYGDCTRKVSRQLIKTDVIMSNLLLERLNIKETHGKVPWLELSVFPRHK